MLILEVEELHKLSNDEVRMMKHQKYDLSVTEDDIRQTVRRTKVNYVARVI